ncbi:hypothetical protein BEWA_036430 [Theileria equi strain WA]|uniref:Uncharacterized protein n=1 Tax=Theileria equi strain WA TaxID=1537102 RepID=L1LDT6_THEEQ|nr:hypothetical protein BEWA_036430 [Theileria equi strain WA]EKX73607.1 hypothetical protein BEWA_036430 [Theileria equi strain WA]|eukprot:XP_004833059.1 hypothetical protein BEWA_036430 [Theileria equi strain WA]
MVVERGEFVWLAPSEEKLVSLSLTSKKDVPFYALLESTIDGTSKKYYFKHRDELMTQKCKTSHEVVLDPLWKPIIEKEYYDAIGNLLYRGFDISGLVDNNEILVQTYRPYGAPTKAFMPQPRTRIKYVIDGYETLWRASEEAEECVLVTLHGNLGEGNYSYHSGCSDESTSSSSHSSHIGSRTRSKTSQDTASEEVTKEFNSAKRELRRRGRSASSSSKTESPKVATSLTDDKSSPTGVSTSTGKSDGQKASRGLKRKRSDCFSSSSQEPNVNVSSLMRDMKIIRIAVKGTQGIYSVYLEKVRQGWFEITREQFHRKMEEFDDEWDETEANVMNEPSSSMT